MRWGELNLKTIKPKRIKRQWLKKIFLVLGFFLLIFGFDKFLTTFFLIRTIEVSGTLEENIQGIEELGGQNLLFFNQKKWEEIIKNKNSLLKTIELKRQFPNQILVIFEKRIPQAIIFDPSSQIAFLIDEEGVILGWQKNESNLPMIMARLQNFQIGDSIKSESLNLMMALIAVLEEKAPGARFEIDEEKRVLTVTLTNHCLILADLEKEKESIIDSLQILVKKFKIEGNWPKKIDLRFEKPILSF